MLGDGVSVGIESVGGTVGSKRSFTVETYSAGRRLQLGLTVVSDVPARW